jgi:hypothetical protein
MVYRGPVGLCGKPEDSVERFRVFEVEGHPEIKCHIEEDVFQWMEDAGPMPEGDYLFMAEGVGRLRFSLL